ncbi:MAG: serine--tRNA ligase [Holosporales bacterium]|jgi:seryl-tRNA synthetase|nr:serine--tRNA ligase [Holosporales bacterium]
MRLYGFVYFNNRLVLDINFIRGNQGVLDKALISRNKEPIEKELFKRGDVYKKLVTEQQSLFEERNLTASEFEKVKREGKDTDELSKKAGLLKEKLEVINAQLSIAKESLEEILCSIPNIPSDECPVGIDETANVEIRRVGIPRVFDFVPLEHYEIGEKLGMMDFKNSAKMAGSRFVLLFSKIAKLERSLAQFMLDIHTKENGYTEVYVPLLLNNESMFGVGQLPKFADDLFKTTVGSYLIPTAEASLTNIHSNSVLLEEELPLRYTAYTPCFRSEAGSAGKDTKGMLRQHQFGKVELVSISHPERAIEEHERMTDCAEGILRRLDLPFRTVVLSTGDMGFASEKTYDIEVWLPGQNMYREISSCSRCSTFQARRLNTKFKNSRTKKNEYVHTLNGSGLAVGRTVIAILENNYNSDGSVSIPTALVPYFGEEKIESRE